MRLCRVLSLAALLAAGAPLSAAAQSLLYRPPNLGGTWVPAAGVLQFNFLHRFSVAPAAANHVVTNYPTFTFALGLGRRLGLGTRFATRSLVGTGSSNEFELFGRLAVGAPEGEPGLALSLTPAYNTAASSLDGELALDFSRGPLTLSLAGRGMTEAYGDQGGRGAVAGGVSLRVNDYVALDGDVGQMLGAGTDAAWSAGLSFVIPGSPHTFSLHAGNATSTTIQGASVGYSRIIYGFEFTIPIHFSRFAPWFARRTPRERAVEINVPFMNAAARVTIQEFKFAADSVVIRAGQAVGWSNRDAVVHTVAFEGPAPTGSGEIAAGGTFVVTFERPGVYRYHCGPHPAMRGVVVVR